MNVKGCKSIMEINQEQINDFLANQKTIIDGMNKLLSLFTLESFDDKTNPVFGVEEAAEFMKVSVSTIYKACNKNEIPFCKLGNKFLFSKIALLSWIHNINMAFITEKINGYKEYNQREYNDNTIMFNNNWIRLEIEPGGIPHEVISLDYDNEEKKDQNTISIQEAAELLGVTRDKMYQWAYGFLFHKTPVFIKGRQCLLLKDKLLEWTKTPEYKKIYNEYKFNSTIQRERRMAAKAKRHAEIGKQKSKSKK